MEGPPQAYVELPQPVCYDLKHVFGDIQHLILRDLYRVLVAIFLDLAVIHASRAQSLLLKLLFLLVLPEIFLVVFLLLLFFVMRGDPRLEGRSLL